VRCDESIDFRLGQVITVSTHTVVKRSYVTKKKNLPRMSWIADFVQVTDKLMDSILLQSNAQKQPVIGRRRTNELPIFWGIVPGVLWFKIIPTFDNERVYEGRLQQAEEESGRPDEGSHC
jgi:hypothetical protein